MAIGDMFVKIDGIEGESEDSSHKKEIQIQSFSFGASNAGSSGLGQGSGTGKVSIQDLHIVKPIDKSSVTIHKFCCNGKHIPTVVLTVRKAGENPQDYLVVTLTESMISSYTITGHEGGGLPMESVSFNFSKIKHDYKPQTATGSLGAMVTMTCDVKQNLVT
jgi:type VI secretion system secreted protein Hcp